MTRASFYVVEKLGPKQSLTPEGFLLCEDVPIARTGEMLYAAGEIPVEPGSDGLIRVSRDAADVFMPTTIASCMGKPVVDDHPQDGEMVSAANWKLLSRGTTMNPRRGPGIEDNLLLADLLIMDADAIQAVRDGKREVSCGYDAEYEQIEPGRARQFNFIINHVALVEKGRCGPRCAIGDHAMSKKTKTSWGDKLRSTLKGLVPTKDAEAAEKAIEEAEAAADAGGGTLQPASQGGVTVNVHPAMGGKDGVGENGNPNGAPANGAGDNEMPTWFKDWEGKLSQRLGAYDEFIKKITDAENERIAAAEKVAADADPDDKDKPAADADPDDKDKGGTEDSTGLVEDYRQTVALAEILSPGIGLPTFDGKARKGKTADALCQLRRKALTKAYETPDGKAIIAKFAGKTTNFNDASLTCDAVRGFFVGAAELTKVANNSRGISAGITKDGENTKPLTPAQINERNRQFWKENGGV